jgi:hypothetical protein
VVSNCLDVKDVLLHTREHLVADIIIHILNSKDVGVLTINTLSIIICLSRFGLIFEARRILVLQHVLYRGHEITEFSFHYIFPRL